jgi:hypothetical protein
VTQSEPIPAEPFPAEPIRAGSIQAEDVAVGATQPGGEAADQDHDHGHGQAQNEERLEAERRNQVFRAEVVSATVNLDDDDLTTVRSVTLELTDPTTADEGAGKDGDETAVGHPAVGHPAAGGPIDPSGPVANQFAQPATGVDPDEDQDAPKLV